MGTAYALSLSSSVPTVVLATKAIVKLIKDISGGGEGAHLPWDAPTFDRLLRPAYLRKKGRNCGKGLCYATLYSMSFF